MNKINQKQFANNLNKHFQIHSFFRRSYSLTALVPDNYRHFANQDKEYLEIYKYRSNHLMSLYTF